MKNKRLLILCGMVLGLCLTMTQSCYYDKEDKLYPTNPAACDTTSISFVAQVKPIISANCYSCHSTANKASLGGGTDLEDFTSLAAQTNTGNLVCDIQHTCNPMPKGLAKLSDCDINKIVAWKVAGTPNN